MNTATALEILVGKIKSDYEKYATNNGQELVTDQMEERLNKFNESINLTNLFRSWKVKSTLKSLKIHQYGVLS
jgi:hypothetical protein